MKTVWIVLIVVLLACVIVWVRSGSTFPIVQSLPLLGGYHPGIYDAGAGAMILITIWGLRRMGRRGDGT